MRIIRLAIFIGLVFALLIHGADSSLTTDGVSRQATESSAGLSAYNSAESLYPPETLLQSSSDSGKYLFDTFFLDTQPRVRNSFFGKNPVNLFVIAKKNVYAPFKAVYGFRKSIRVRLNKRLFVLSVILICTCATGFFAWFMFARSRDSERFLTADRLSVVDREVRIACAYIEKNFADPELDVKKTCEELETGEAFLEALFNRELGISAGRFIVQVRMNRAKRILDKTPNIPVEELAERAGYVNVKEFQKEFAIFTSKDS
jgi:AraC-like DNA-binding protein